MADKKSACVLEEPEDARIVVIDGGDGFELYFSNGIEAHGYSMRWTSAVRLMRWMLCRYLVSLFGLRVWLLRRAQRESNDAPTK